MNDGAQSLRQHGAFVRDFASTEARKRTGDSSGTTKFLLPRPILSAEGTCSTDSYENSKCSQQHGPENPKKPRQEAAGKRANGNAVARRQRKATYHVRKEEKSSLLAELKRLQAQVQTLQNQKCCDQATLDHTASVANPLLRDVVQEQECAIASVQSVVSGYLTSLPFQVNIALGKDPSKRHATLVAIKETQIRNSLRYLTERTRFLDPSAPHAESSQCVTPNGGFCWRRLDRTVFETAKSTRQVFDALIFFLLNKEIIISEVLGDLTLREDDSAWHQGVFQNRIVSNVTRDVQVETNSALFSAFYDQHDACGGGRPFGVITTDFVNADELYPYSPTERVRSDVTAVLTVTSEVRTGVNSSGEEEDELVVVLTRVCLLQLHNTELQLPSSVIQEIRDNIGKWGELMLTTVKETVYRQAAHQVKLTKSYLLSL
ncbi:hypothetical protein FI667_g7655, partial [Globisporangium splendens]